VFRVRRPRSVDSSTLPYHSCSENFHVDSRPRPREGGGELVCGRCAASVPHGRWDPQVGTWKTANENETLTGQPRSVSSKSTKKKREKEFPVALL
jgi:hypothetical protein